MADSGISGTRRCPPVADVSDSPADSAGDHRRTGLETVLQGWTVRAGPESAAHRVRYYRRIFHAWISVLVGVTLVLVGTFSGTKVVTYLGLAGIAGWLVLCVLAGIEIHRMNRAMSRAFGIPISFFGGPPGRNDLYLAWCKRRDVMPNAFAKADPPVVRTRWL